MVNVPWPDLKWGYNFTSESLIDRARAVAATQFLDHDQGDILLFIDDDIKFQPPDIYKIAQDVRELGTVVCAPYQIKNLKERRLALHPLNNDGIMVGPGGKIQEVKYASSGFMAIPKKVLEDLAKVLPRLDTGAGITDGKPNVTMYPFFQPTWTEEEMTYLSEDYAFCLRARKLGYKIMLDSQIVLAHSGPCDYVNGGAQ
jgi:hypothetical protein